MDALFPIGPRTYRTSADNYSILHVETGTLATSWRPRWRDDGVTWTAWSNEANPDTLGDSSGTRLTIRLARCQIDRSPRSFISAIKASRGYANAANRALESGEYPDDMSEGEAEGLLEAEREAYFRV